MPISETWKTHLRMSNSAHYHCMNYHGVTHFCEGWIIPVLNFVAQLSEKHCEWHLIEMFYHVLLSVAWDWVECCKAEGTVITMRYRRPIITYLGLWERENENILYGATHLRTLQHTDFSPHNFTSTQIWPLVLNNDPVPFNNVNNLEFSMFDCETMFRWWNVYSLCVCYTCSG